MASEQETVADIVAEMHYLGKLDEKSIDKIPRTLMGLGLRTYADRIEAAAKRERGTAWNEGYDHAKRDFRPIADELERLRNTPIGNATAMREALEYVLNFDASNDAAMGDGISDAERIAEYADHIEESQKKAHAALSAPPRNCDVGTAEEQAERYMKFCKNYPKCTGCPCVGRMQYHKCEFAWAQMPYEAQEGGAK